MNLTSNMRRFAEFQISLCNGLDFVAELPVEVEDLLLCREEWEAPERDIWDNRDFQHNSLFWSGRYLEPVINRELLKNKNVVSASLSAPWPEGKKFAVCLSHDVDRITFALWWARWRRLKEVFPLVLKDKPYLTSKLKSLFSSRLTGRKDPASSMIIQNKPHSETFKKGDFFSPWLSIEERYGFRSTFFFFPDLPSRYHEFDRPMYRHSDIIGYEGERVSISEMMRHLDRRGWEVGLHGTFYSFDDVQELKRQKEQVERTVQKEVVSIRQHYLHFDISKTPRAQGEAGLKFDSSFGSNRLIGFRNGMAFPFYFYDLAADIPLPVLEIPLHIQDGALFSLNNLGLSPPLALQRAKEMIDRVEETEGLVTLLWHPHSADEVSFPGWFWVYAELLSYVAQKDAWVAPVREIGNWWEERQRSLGITWEPLEGNQNQPEASFSC
jgi:peptidoglycan/xylan/chitin deacetylase (PgdA/CDA1 family)